MDNKRKRTSDDDGDHVQKKSKQPIVTEDANGTASTEMTDCDIMSLMMPNGLPANCTENPERNPRVHRVRTGQSMQGEFSGNRTEIMVWDSNDPAIVDRSDNVAAPTTVNIISSDDEINDGDTTCFENPMGLIESTSISQQQQQFFTHPVFDNHNLDVIDLTSDDDVINSHSIENYGDIDETLLELQQQHIFANPVLDNHNVVVIELPSEDDIDIFINSYPSIENDETLLEQIFAHHQYDSLDVIELSSENDIYINFVINSYNSIENDEEMIDETHLETISEEPVNSIPVGISIDEEQQQLSTFLDNHNLDVIDLTSEDDVINSHYSVENYEDIDVSRLETISEESINLVPLRISMDGQQQLTLLDSNNWDVIDLTSEDDGDTNLYYSIEHVDE